jgi:predicted RNase H-like HicB family nuclease
LSKSNTTGRRSPRDLPGCITAGATLEETERNVREAIEGHIRTLIEFGESVPPHTAA